MTYRLVLPSSLEGIYDVFHMSQLRRYLGDESHVLDHSELELQPDLSCTEQPTVIMDRSVKDIEESGDFVGASVME